MNASCSVTQASTSASSEGGTDQMMWTVGQPLVMVGLVGGWVGARECGKGRGDRPDCRTF
jgi:hypothetical protein